MLDRGKRNLRCKRQRGDRCPRREGAVIGLGHASCEVTVESAPIHMQRLGTLNRPFTGRDPPGKLTIPLKLIRVLNSMLLMNISGAAAVFKVVDATGPHGLILNAPKIDQNV